MIIKLKLESWEEVSHAKQGVEADLGTEMCECVFKSEWQILYLAQAYEKCADTKVMSTGFHYRTQSWGFLLALFPFLTITYWMPPTQEGMVPGCSVKMRRVPSRGIVYQHQMEKKICLLLLALALSHHVSLARAGHFVYGNVFASSVKWVSCLRSQWCHFQSVCKCSVGKGVWGPLQSLWARIL